MKKSAVVVMLVILAGCRGETAAPPAQPAGPPLPAYKAQWLDGSPFDMASEKGNVVMLNVWATWCGPCVYEIPELGKLHAKYASRGFKVVGVSIDEGGAKDVKPFVDEQKVPYPIVIDPEGKLAQMLSTTVIPTSVVVDRAGAVVWKHFGVVDPDDETLTKAVEAALSR